MFKCTIKTETGRAYSAIHNTVKGAIDGAIACFMDAWDKGEELCTETRMTLKAQKGRRGIIGKLSY